MFSTKSEDGAVSRIQRKLVALLDKVKADLQKRRIKDLHDAERHLAQYRASAAYQAAMVAFYTERVSQLKEEIELAALPAEPRGVVVPYSPVESANG